MRLSIVPRPRYWLPTFYVDSGYIIRLLFTTLFANKIVVIETLFLDYKLPGILILMTI